MDIFCVQESRGSWAHILKYLRLILRDYWVRASFGNGCGGIITFISKASSPNDSDIVEHVIVAGRAHSVRISSGEFMQVTYNFHNFELNQVVMAAWCNTVENDLSRAAADLLHYNK